MCFYFSINKPKKVIEERFDSSFDSNDSFKAEPYANAFSKPTLPVIVNSEPDRIHLFKWGLIPHWVKGEENANKISSATFNARSETIFEKPSFRDAIKTQRCLVIADGFFEWKSEGKTKMRHFIQIKDNELFAFAGIWNSWVNKNTAEVVNTFSIITQEANPFMAEIHNIKKRQPVILNRENEAKWLSKNYDFKSIMSCSYSNQFKAELY